jgi:hypothetical protein
MKSSSRHAAFDTTAILLAFLAAALFNAFAKDVGPYLLVAASALLALLFWRKSAASAERRLRFGMAWFVVALALVVFVAPLYQRLQHAA